MEQCKSKTRTLILFRFFVVFSMICYLVRLPVMADEEEQTIRVGYYPLVNYHALDETGNITGYEIDFLNKISEKTGWNYEYIPAKSWNHAMEMLANHEVDLISPSQIVGSRMEDFGFSSMPIGKLYSAIFTLPSDTTLYEDFKEFSNMTFGIEDGVAYKDLFLDYATENNFQPTMINYKTYEDLVDALNKGEADVLMQNQYTVENYLTKPQYSQLAIIPYEGMADSLSLSLILSPKNSMEMNPVLSDRKLIGILNKGIMNVTEEEISRIIISHTTGRPYKFSFRDFLYQYRYTIGILLVVSVICAQYGIFTYRIRKKSLKSLKTSEKKLRNITNNINGGVVVLLPNEEFKITYANEGFLDLIQYTKQEFADLCETSYIMYIHEDDSTIIRDIMKKDFIKDEQISVRLRIRRKDGTYLPTRFNGTITKNDDGAVEIYCVIMDISQEVSMLRSLELEQRKHNLIVEKANEIIYEIDLYKQLVQVSNSFYEQFGWVFSKTLPSTGIQDWIATWNLYPEDIELFKSMLSSSMEHQVDDSCNIRIMNIRGEFRWYRISHYIMQDESGKFLLIVGKITDIDEEMKERIILEELSQLDSTTGLYNKETFLRLSRQYLNKSHDTNSAMVFLDLDHFKSVNDLLGHMTGDKAILDAAKKLQIIFSSYDLLARFGGDEFCILVKDIPQKTLEKKLSWALEKLCETYHDGQQTVTVTASIGVAFTSESGCDLATLIEGADKALYQAKENGRNQYCVYKN